MAEDRAPAERVVNRALDGAPGVGKPLSRSSTQYARSIENYLKAGNRPRWMERLVEIDAGVKEHERRLRAAQRRLREEVGDDAEAFARRWRETAERWDFGEHNVLVHQHNEWYPIERQLPVDLRTRDYVKIGGRSYRREMLDAAWVLRQFPAE